MPPTIDTGLMAEIVCHFRFLLYLLTGAMLTLSWLVVSSCVKGMKMNFLPNEWVRRGLVTCEEREIARATAFFPQAVIIVAKSSLEQ